MQRAMLGLRLLLVFLLPLTSVQLEEVEEVSVEVIVDSTPCSATCGLGTKTQTLCLLKDGRTALEEGGARQGDGGEVSQRCRVRKVKCLESWRCSLTTSTVTSGQRVEMDCLEEVMEAMGRFSWRVSWRFARGVVTSVDSLFARRDAPLLDRVVLDPVREEDAGTYRCDVQDSAFRRVKRVYWGIRVLPIGVLNLDYERSLSQWDSDQNRTVPDQQAQAVPLHYTVLISLGLAAVSAGTILSCLYWTLKRRHSAGSTKER
ncbi:transmembrane protein 81 [Brachionichthys hirsutus]|uniref:transmembrane protein 81 n=1 Tax=Brachionichthys hirsutus TaxID=412623 RepID=UPI0036045CB5